MRKGITRIAVTISFLILAIYAVKATVTGHSVPLYLMIAPTISVLCGLNYLRIRNRESTSIPRNGHENSR